MAAVEVVGAVGDDDRDRVGERTREEEGEEVARRAVGPVDVLEHHHDRALVREPPEQAEDDLEEPRLGGGAGDGSVGTRCRSHLGRAEVGKEPGQLTAAGADDLRQPLRRERPQQRPKRTDERGVWQPGLAELKAAAQQHLSPRGAGLVGELADEARLADTGLARDQACRRPIRASVRERVGQTADLGGAAHEDGAADAGHGGDHSHRSLEHASGAAPSGRQIRQCVRACRNDGASIGRRVEDRRREMAKRATGSPLAPPVPRSPRVSPRAIPMAPRYP